MARITKIAVYPGSFDPITLGHIDILKRALRVFDKVIVGVGINDEKNPVFSDDERIQLIKAALKEHNIRAEVTAFRGLLVEFALRVNAKHIIRGLRAVSDFDYEFQIATINRNLSSNLDSVFFMTDKEYFYLSSTMIKSLATHGASLIHMVPHCVELALKKKLIRQP